MDKRFFVAIALAIGVLLITPKLFPPAATPIVPGADSTSAAAPSTPMPEAPPAAAAAAPVPAATVAVKTGATAAATTAPVAFAAETATVVTPRATFRFSSAGGAMIGAELTDYKQLPARTSTVELARRGSALVTYKVILGADTTDLAQRPLKADTSALHTASTVRYDGTTPGAAIALEYTFAPDSYLVRVRGTLKSSGATPARLAIVLPQGLATHEADTLDDHSNLAFVWRRDPEDAQSVTFASVAKTGLDAKAGPFSWVASKNKYFLLAVLAPPKGSFTGPAIFTAPVNGAKVPTVATGEVILSPDAEGRFSFDIYAGPQQWRLLLALGRDLEHVNPYGGWFRSIVQPFATIVMRILLWMHDTFKINYGWVLVIFGVAVRLILWPLNQSAMRSSLRMQRIQPELQALQTRFKSNPEKMHTEYMKLLQEHGMTPFSQFSGCLPMLIPMPVLFALFFVFRNTIEFRGVSFLWMADISLKDPYFILPVVMGVSMFLLSWVGMRNAPPNPQAKMLGYMMPGMMVVLFLRFAAGLNLYYAVQNIAALPQQWLIAKERAKKTAT